MDDLDEDDILHRLRTGTGPIEHHLEILATCDELPMASLGICLIRIDEAAPPLLALLERAAAGEALDDGEASQLFLGIHILGAARDPRAAAPLLRLLHRTDEKLDPLIGDTITETLARIVAGAFDGDADALFATIADPSVDQFVRNALFGAAAYLTWEGRIDQEAMRAFLELYFQEGRARERSGEPLDFAWNGWQEAIALLGLRELRPLVDQAWEEDLISDRIVSQEYFEQVLAAAERDPADPARWSKARLGYIEDIGKELEWAAWRGSDDDWAMDDGEWAVDEYDDLIRIAVPTEPALNRWRDVGRNDPCPCGSGRKFKKCCLGTEGAEEG